MNKRKILICGFGLMLIFLFSYILIFSSLAGDKNSPKAKLIPLNPANKEYQRILAGAAETVSMHSGLVTLEAGKSVGTHNTEKYEEVLVILEGEGKMVITDGPTLNLKAWSVAYCPPRTEHNVTCTGSTALRYVYIVAKAE